MTGIENRIYEQDTKEQQNWQEQLKQHKFSNNNKEIWKKLSNTILKIEKKLWKFSNKNEQAKDFFIRNMNDYVQSKYGVKFTKADVNGKTELILKLPKDASKTISKLSDLVNKLKIVDNQNETDIFIDENKNEALDKDEIGVKIKANTMEANSTYVDKNELKNKQVNFWTNWDWRILDKRYTHNWKIVMKDGKDYYDVSWTTDKNWHYDYLSAVSRLSTALSSEYLWWMDLNTINKKIQNLHYNSKTWEFKVFDLKSDDWWEKVWDTNSNTWKKIVKPGAMINLTSLSDALNIWKVKAEKLKNKSELKNATELKNTIDKGWWRFYESVDGEVWDIPDNWNIKYNWYSKDYDNLNWNQISIWAKNSYNFKNKNNNKFTEKKEIDLWNNKKGYLVIWESNKNINIKWVKTIEWIQKKLKNSWVEAWFTTKNDKNKTTITEVGDKKVHTITETTNNIEKWKIKDNPIILDSNIYKFSWEINWEIEFKIPKNKSKIEQLKDKNWTDKLELWIEKIKINNKEIQIKDVSKEQFNKIFPWWEWYLLVNEHLVKLSFDKNKEWIKIKNLWEKKEKEFTTNEWIKISNWFFSRMKFNKKTGKVEFPEIIWWWKINGKLEKEKDNTNVAFSLGEDYKILDKDIKIDLWKNKKIKPDDILEKTIAWLLLLANQKENILNNEKINNSEEITIDIWNNKIKIWDKSINLTVNNKENILNNEKINNSKILTKEKNENSDTYIIDAIKDKFKMKENKKLTENEIKITDKEKIREK